MNLKQKTKNRSGNKEVTLNKEKRNVVAKSYINKVDAIVAKCQVRVSRLNAKITEKWKATAQLPQIYVQCRKSVLPDKAHGFCFQTSCVGTDLVLTPPSFGFHTPPASSYICSHMSSSTGTVVGYT